MMGQYEVKIYLLYSVEIYMQCICAEKSDLFLFNFLYFIATNTK